jgi:segregation and condensation protein A
MYKVKIQNFEGPLDLLLFFVRKDELNIYDIPIAHITRSYLEYLRLMEELNLDIAAEFILMAATLMRIKVKMMLPRDPDEEEEEEPLDPREELTRRLIEYRQFKEASKSLAELNEYWRSVYRRTYFNFDLIPQQSEEPVGLKDVTFFDLLAAYKKALAKKPKVIYHNIERLNVTIEQQQDLITGFFDDKKCYLFSDLCMVMSKVEIVVTFLAMLELIRRGEIAVKQATIFDDIWIYRPDAYAEEEMHALEEAEAQRQQDEAERGLTETVDDTEHGMGTADAGFTDAVLDEGGVEEDSRGGEDEDVLDFDAAEGPVVTVESTDTDEEIESSDASVPTYVEPETFPLADLSREEIERRLHAFLDEEPPREPLESLSQDEIRNRLDTFLSEEPGRGVGSMMDDLVLGAMEEGGQVAEEGSEDSDRTDVVTSQDSESGARASDMPVLEAPPANHGISVAVSVSNEVTLPGQSTALTDERNVPDESLTPESDSSPPDRTDAALDGRGHEETGPDGVRSALENESKVTRWLKKVVRFVKRILTGN